MAQARTILAGLLAAVSLGIASGASWAQDAFPSKPIRMIVPFPPGGFVDILARVVTPKMAETLGQNILIDNRAGANGNIGIEIAAKAQPDGYTLVLAQISNLAINPLFYKDATFYPLRDLTPIGFVAAAPQLLVVSADSELRSLTDLVALARARPGALMFASSGNASLGHLGIELIQLEAKVRFTHVPYKGAAPATIDVIGGRAHAFIAAVPSVIGQIRAGKLRALAVTSKGRIGSLPDVPPLHESGLPGYESVNWLAVMGRAGTPQAIVDRLNAALNKALEQPDIKARFENEGASPLASTPKHLGDQLAADHAKWKRVIGEAGIRLE